MMKIDALLSVVVTVYNTEDFLPRCLDSVLNCTYKNLELIVVDDKSLGNVDEIMQEYSKYDKRIKYIKHEKNRGLYHARITGAEQAKGKYIAFLDSDDHVSVDFYRKLIKKAEETDSDMVMGEYYLEFEDGTYKYQNLAHSRVLDIDLRDDKVSDLLFEQHGLDFSLHVVWNKIYRKDLWDKCYPYFIEQKKHLVMCEDVLFSSLFFYFSRHMTNIHYDFVYYYQNSNSSTKKNASVESYKKNISDVDNVFIFLLQVFQEEIKNDKYIKYILEWKKYLSKIWQNNINNSSLGFFEKKQLLNFMRFKSDESTNKKDEFFYSIYTDVTLIGYEEIKKKISNPKIKIISFDIFDTLVLRPFFSPTDIFDILDVFVNSVLNTTDKINFKKLRIEAELFARKLLQTNQSMSEEISLDDIYNSLKSRTNIPNDILDKIKSKEIELEKKYCYQRKFAKELFDMALHLNKKIIITSDMYLPIDVIKDILKKNNYHDIFKIYLSSEIKLTKESGNLFSYIINDLKVKPQSILHVGDNVHSDIKCASNKGYNVFYMPKTMDLFTNSIKDIYGGEAFTNIYENPYNLRARNSFRWFIGMRSIFGILANKIYDNPYFQINKNSDFNANPAVIGYYVLGPHLFAIAHWLINEVKNKKYDNINFMARDGYLPMEAFKRINNIFKLNIKINYTHITRSAVLPLQISNLADIYCLENNMNLLAQSPKKIITLFKDFIKKIYWIMPRIYVNSMAFFMKKNSVLQKPIMVFKNYLEMYFIIKMYS